ncbi:MAG: hypothetical protein WBA29_13010 [Xanthobacteraceae bacterium]
MADYRLTNSDMVVRASDGASVPNDPGNRDRRLYEEWCAGGGVPEPYVAPPEPLPLVVSAAQGRLALLDAGLLATVKAAVDQADEATQIWFEYATEWQRDHPILLALGAQVGLSGSAIDDLFRAAALL